MSIRPSGATGKLKEKEDCYDNRSIDRAASAERI